jgi:hypothetical protein
MSTGKSGNLDRIVAEARRAAAERERSYREQALNIYPWMCGRVAAASSRVRTCASRPSTTGITIMTTTHPTAATGSCCACNAMTGAGKAMSKDPAF